MRLRAALCLLPMLLAACSLFETDNSTPPAPLPDFQAQVSLEKVDSFDVGNGRQQIFQPAQIGERIISGNADGKVVLWNGHDSNSFDLRQPLSAGFAANEQAIFAATRQGAVIATNYEGKPLWSVDLGTEILTRPQLFGDLLLVHGLDGRLFALSSKDGSIVWQAESHNPPLVLRVHTEVAVDGKVVFVGYPGGKLRAFDLDTGHPLWDATVAQPKGATDLERVTDIVGAPWVSDGEVCVASYQGRVGCFDTKDGSPRWAKDLSSSSGVDGDQHNLYVVDANSVVLAYDKHTGKQLWSQNKLLARALTRPTVFGHYIAVGDYKGYIHLLDADTGAIVGRGEADNTIIAPLQLRNEQLLVQTVDGRVSLFALHPHAN